MEKKSQKKDNFIVLRPAVYQSNPLIQARKEFNLMGTRIFLIGLRGLNPHFSKKDKKYDAEFYKMFISTAQLTELFGGNTKYLHDLKKECKKLFEAIIEFEYPDGGFRLLHIFSELSYEPRKGLYLQFDEKMRPYLLDLFESNGYTKLDVEQLFLLSSPYAVRLVELMLQYQNLPIMKLRREIIRVMSVEEIRFALNVPDDSYKGRIDNFQKRVLDSPIKEINEKTIYQMSYRVKKTGSTIFGFEFHMDIRSVPRDDVRGKDIEAAIKTLMSLGFNRKAAEGIFDRCNSVEDCFWRINNALNVFNRQTRRKISPIKNKLGFLRRAILGRWVVGVFRTGFTKFEGKARTRKEVLTANKEKKKADFPEPEVPRRKPISAEDSRQIHNYLCGDAESRKLGIGILKSLGWTMQGFLAKYPF